MKRKSLQKTINRVFLLGVTAVSFSFLISVHSCKKNEDLEINETVSVEQNQSGDIISGKYIVAFNPTYTKSLAQSSSYEESLFAVKELAEELLSDDLLKSEIKFDHVYSTAFVGFSASLKESQVALLKQSPEVISIQPDRQMQIDARELAPASEQLPVTKASGSDYWPWGINYVGGAYYGDDKTAWIIDSGIDLDHPDLNVDQNRGRNFCSFYTNNPGPNDDNGHGTHVAGTIAAKYNGIGVVGIAANATVIPVKVVDSRGYGKESDCAKAVDYVAYNGERGDVVNMSLGYSPNTIIDQAVRNAAAKGIKFAIAAGNENSNAKYVTPARVVAPNVYKVCAIDSDGKWASFSNYGDVVDWAAPGVSVWSTYKDGGYSKLDGTSMASPHIAGMLLVTDELRSQGQVKCPYDGKYYSMASF